ncbi:hypothetical protein GGH92_004672 [Coemansia sp. RSA 2673]|nr:hypothetical protein GGH92_004672 [Coemansia sp. RSA 2673]
MVARSADLTTRFYNREGARPFAVIADLLDLETQKLLRFLGDITSNGRLILAHRARARPGAGRPWLAVAARMLARYSIEVDRPSVLQELEMGALVGLRTGTADEIITSMYDKSITDIEQAFVIWPGGSVRVQEGGGPHISGIGRYRAHGSDPLWRAKIREELERVRKGEVTAEDSWIDTDAVRQALYVQDLPDM